MVEKSKLKPIASAVGITLAATLAASPLATADQNPFAVSEMSGGYMVAEAEGKCGEGKCGEGKCGEDKAEDEGKCGEGKCGEGKCGDAAEEDETAE
ncbi:MAG TPA: hypothetical protein VF268_04730 [Gammaproteobacteria bacterium]|jgi:uncharacterized low-complexity protein